MKLRGPFAVAAANLLLVSCGAPSSEPLGTSESANTTDAGDGGALNCANVPAGPFAPQLLGEPFNGSEDFAFDGRGHMVGKRGAELIIVDRQGAAAGATLASLPGQTYGLRYAPNGDLIAAIPGAGKVVRVSPAGRVSDLLTGLTQPNGIYVDFDSNVWLTEFGGSRVSRLDPSGTRTTIASGAAVAQAANGVALDASKKILFYTEYSKGRLNRVAVDVPGATPVPVTTVPGASLDGLVLDACGNVYAVDQGRSRIYRVRVDAAGAAIAPAELLATFPTNVANAQFGSGPGFEPNRLYVTGNPGSVYSLDIGVPGMAVP